MTAVGCGIVELNPLHHSIKQREKSGLAAEVFQAARRHSTRNGCCNLITPRLRAKPSHEYGIFLF
jgi:hypothetical protein